MGSARPRTAPTAEGEARSCMCPRVRRYSLPPGESSVSRESVGREFGGPRRLIGSPPHGLLSGARVSGETSRSGPEDRREQRRSAVSYTHLRAHETKANL